MALVPVMVGAVLDRARGVAPDAWRRALTAVLDGFRPAGAGALPGAPLTPDQLEQLMAAGGPRRARQG
ncbi:hypothetical protein [Modestobacter versicolor]|uniref:Uncharacterized protein n=1 Tax=Modestobacter versicolor TaxID=429133 RepID=A0A323V6D1_9ACTN|nr:hypothetical protein [Modestobacter versicolor]MBB3677534.1 hypothetical protein [Modestobacter versicolor]PZA19630.1 hypothetical protein DMO24_19695 [Modestobacter versicolor]